LRSRSAETGGQPPKAEEDDDAVNGWLYEGRKRKWRERVYGVHIVFEFEYLRNCWKWNECIPPPHDDLHGTEWTLSFVFDENGCGAFLLWCIICYSFFFV